MAAKSSQSISPPPLRAPASQIFHKPLSHQLFTSVSAVSSIGIHKDHGEDTFQVLNTVMPETLEDVVHLDDAFSRNLQYFSITRSFTPNRMGVIPGEISQNSFTEIIENRIHPNMTKEELRLFWLNFMQETDKRVNHWIGSLNSRGNIGCSFLGLILMDNHYTALNVGSNVLYLYRDGICRQLLHIQAFAADSEEDRPARYFGTHAGWKEWRLQNCTHGDLKDGDIFILGTNSFFRFGGDVIDLGFQLKQILPLHPSSVSRFQSFPSPLSSGSQPSRSKAPSLDEEKTSLFLPGSGVNSVQSQPTQVMPSQPGERSKIELIPLGPPFNPAKQPSASYDPGESKEEHNLDGVLREIHQKAQAQFPASDLTLLAIQVCLQSLPTPSLPGRVPPPLSQDTGNQRGGKRGQAGSLAPKKPSLVTEDPAFGSSSVAQEENLQAIWALGLKKAILAFFIGILLGLFLIALWSFSFL